MKFPTFIIAPLLKHLKNNSAILMYHGVTGTDDAGSNLLDKHILVEEFERQLVFFKRHFQILPLEEMLQAISVGQYPRNSLAITFDDGYRNFYWHAYPVLKRLALPATVFLATGFIDSDRWATMDSLEYAFMISPRRRVSLPGRAVEVSIDTPQERLAAIFLAKQIVKAAEFEAVESLAGQIIASCGVTLPLPFGNYQFLKWREVREMLGQTICFGPHSVNHAILARCTKEKAEWEVMQSKRQVEEQTGQFCNCFCYPNGLPDDYNEEIKAICASQFRFALSAKPGVLLAAEMDSYEIRRIGLNRKTTLSSLTWLLFKQMIKCQN